ncbi:MAG: hypothetical protein ACPG52_06265 [Cognaticolwellia sp.]
MVTSLVLKSPVHLSVDLDGQEKTNTLNFLNTIDKYTILEKKMVLIDLSDVVIATATASLMLFAFVNRSQILTPELNLIRFKFPSRKVNSEGYRWIVQTGLSKALLCNTIDKITGLTESNSYFQSSISPDTHSYKTAAMLQKEAKMTSEQFELLSSGISEAMLNVNHHAYENERYSYQTSRMGKRWWQCCWFDSMNDSTVFIICDLGEGLCNTYIDNQNLFSINNLKLIDVAKEALAEGYSRFKNVGRGNGSEDMKRPIKSNISQYESLNILSHRIQYVYSYQKNCLPSETYEITPELFPGTIIKWVLTPKRES